MPHKLLLADDSVTIQRVIELTFADEDITVIAVGDGRQAIERALSDRPDIVLADVGMPERDGYEVSTFIKGSPELAHIPVLLLTGAFEPIDEARARAAGCDGVLVKPFEPQMVISRVKELIAGKRPAVPTSSFAPPFETPPVTGSFDPAAATGSVDEYFDRLGAAFSVKDAPQAPRSPDADQQVTPPSQREAVDRPASPAGVATGLASELAAWEPDMSEAAAVPATAPPAPALDEPSAVRDGRTSPEPPTLAEAFAALLSAEQQHPFMLAGLSREESMELLIEQVTTRVIERMSEATVREVVLDVAERLVTEEIARIKGG